MSENEKYNVFNSEELDLYYENLTKQDVINYFNNMIEDINNDCDENYPLAKNIEDVFDMQKDFGWLVKDVSDVRNEVFKFLIEQALRFNIAWHGSVILHNDNSYNFEIKPLYFDIDKVLFQIELLNNNKRVVFTETHLSIFDNNIEKNIKMLLEIYIHDKFRIKNVKF